MRIGFFLREAVRATRRSPASSFAALATVLVTMLMLGVFIPIVQATNGAANTVRSRVEVDVYFKSGATKADEARVHRKIAAVPHVKRVVFVSKAAGAAPAGEDRSGGLQAAGDQPAARHLPGDPDQPAVRVVDPRGADAQRFGGSAFDPSVQTVSNKKTDTKKILQVTNLVTITAAILTVLLVIASVLLIANTIRLSLYSRRREVEVMKLVGATDWFIRWPFVIEGMVVGAAGAALALVVLAADQGVRARSAGEQLDADRHAARRSRSSRSSAS